MTTNSSGLARVVNKKDSSFDIYIGRPSKWGNPYKIGKDGTREEVIEQYRNYLLFNNPKLMRELYELQGKTLGCYCKPLPCHGDVLVEFVNRLPQVVPKIQSGDSV